MQYFQNCYVHNFAFAWICFEYLYCKQFWIFESFVWRTNWMYYLNWNYWHFFMTTFFGMFLALYYLCVLFLDVVTCCRCLLCGIWELALVTFRLFVAWGGFCRCSIYSAAMWIIIYIWGGMLKLVCVQCMMTRRGLCKGFGFDRFWRCRALSRLHLAGPRLFHCWCHIFEYIFVYICIVHSNVLYGCRSFLILLADA